MRDHETSFFVTPTNERTALEFLCLSSLRNLILSVGVKEVGGLSASLLLVYIFERSNMEGERDFGFRQFLIQSDNSGTAAIPSSTLKLSHRDEQGTIRLELNGRQVNWSPLSDRLLFFSRVIGLPIVHVNGQRVTGPPHDYKGPTPPRGAEVFVGGLPRDRDATEEELLPVFSHVGRIYQLRLMMDFSGTNRGYCFVQFFTIQEATNAIRVLKNYELRPGRPLGVFRSVENRRLQLDGIPFTLSPETVYTEMVRVSDGVTKVTLFSMSMPGPPEFWTSSAIVEYESHWDAAMARRDLLPRGFTMNGFPVSVEWAKPEK